MAGTSIKLRRPTLNRDSPIDTDFTPPTTEWMSGTWHVTHSTLPMWKNNRNVTITYKPLDRIENGVYQLDDIVKYQPLKADNIKTIVGVDTQSTQSPGAWDWRGKGWLKLITSHWEVLGYGKTDAGTPWAVTFFQKTLFTPAGIDIYSKDKGGLQPKFVDAIAKALSDTEDPTLKSLATELFVVRSD